MTAAKKAPDLIGSLMYLVYDGMGNCHEHHDTLEEAVEYAETLVGEYQDNVGDGWPNDGDIEILQVVRRWSLLPVPPPPDEDPETPWVDLLPAELPQVPMFTLEEIQTESRALLNHFAHSESRWTSEHFGAMGAAFDALLLRLQESRR